jgi:DNA-binding beta-propeller fold protein YncE
VAGTAAVTAAAVLVPVGIGAIGHGSGPAGGSRPAGPAVYAAFYLNQCGQHTNVCPAAVIPISTATNKPGHPIKAGPYSFTDQIAITPDGKTAYVTCDSAVVPISTATNTPGKPIHVPFKAPETIAIAP